MSQAIQAASETLVERARQGDQNAIGMIVAIRENRKTGNPKAGLAFDYIASYIKDHPVKKDRCLVGGESANFAGFGHAARKCRKGGPGYGKAIVKNALEMGHSVYDARIAAHIVALGRPVDMGAIRDVLAMVPPHIRPAFRMGYENPHAARRKAAGLTATELKLVKIGFIMGLAMRVQKVCEPDAPLRLLSPLVGWELGE